MNKMISAKNAPAAVGPYSHAVLAGNTLYTSGQLGLDPVSGELAAGVEALAKQAEEAAQAEAEKPEAAEGEQENA